MKVADDAFDMEVHDSMILGGWSNYCSHSDCILVGHELVSKSSNTIVFGNSKESVSLELTDKELRIIKEALIVVSNTLAENVIEQCKHGAT